MNTICQCCQIDYSDIVSNHFTCYSHIDTSNKRMNLCNICVYTYEQCNLCGRIDVNNDALFVLQTHSGSRKFCRYCVDKFSICETCRLSYQPTHQNILCCRNCVKYTKYTQAKKIDKSQNGRYFSIELELLDKYSKWRNLDATVFSTVGDGSLSMYGIEISNTIPFNHKDLIYIKSLCNFYKKNYQIDNTCGYHLHLDCTSETENIIEKFARFCIACQDSVITLVTTDRNKQFYKTSQDNFKSYCMRLPGIPENESFDNYLYHYLDKLRKEDRKPYGEKYRGPRYYWWNFHSYFYRKTVECRLHHGTMNYREIVCWIELWTKVFDWVKDNYHVSSTVVDILDIAKLAGVKNSVINYYKIKRARHLTELSDGSTVIQSPIVYSEPF